MLERPYDGNSKAKGNLIYKDFEDRVNNFVGNLLKDYSPHKYNESKVIHDPVWGTTLFYPWELQILDSPLLQRLRNISQLGLAMFTYPSAHHTRFEHTLGVMSVVTKMVNHINQKDEKSSVIPTEEHYMLRLAALLHDIGHCFCSHLSESIYGKFKEFVELKNAFKIFESAKEHEIFAYIIINSTSFREFTSKKLQLPFVKNEDVPKYSSNIGDMIVGAMLPYRSNDNVRRYYLTQIINGQYDADKLDYLRRDSYTAGLALTYDIDRFLYKIKIEDRDESGEDDKIIRGKHLVIPVTGITAVEEMAFSQLMLASYIYQHQKVLAADALMSDIVRAFKEHKKLSHPCDFLYYCDSDILGTSKESTNGDFKTEPFDSNSGLTIAGIVQKIKNRDLPKRAFIINTSTVKPDKQGRDPKPYPASDIAERLSKIEGLRNEIVKMSREIANNDCLPDDIRRNKHVDYYDVHISIPNTCIAKDLSNALVLKNNKEFVRLSDIVRLSDWADAFAWHKWHAYVFAKEAILPIVSIASKIVFEKHGIIFNDDAVVFAGIKCSDKIIELIKKLKDNNKYPL